MNTNEKATFVLLLELLVAGALPQVRQDLRQFADDYVVSGERRLSLRNKNSSVSRLYRKYDHATSMHLFLSCCSPELINRITVSASND